MGGNAFYRIPFGRTSCAALRDRFAKSVVFARSRCAAHRPPGDQLPPSPSQTNRGSGRGRSGGGNAFYRIPLTPPSWRGFEGRFAKNGVFAHSRCAAHRLPADLLPPSPARQSGLRRGRGPERGNLKGPCSFWFPLSGVFMRIRLLVWGGCLSRGRICLQIVGWCWVPPGGLWR